MMTLAYLACMTHHPQYGSVAARQREHVTYLLHSCTGNLYTCDTSRVLVIKVLQCKGITVFGR